MALALAKAAPLRPEIKLSQALSDYKASLSAEQRKSLDCSLPDYTAVLALTCEIDRQNAGRRIRRCGARLTTFLNSVQGFTSTVDLMVWNVGEPIAGAVWGAVKTALQAASGFQGYFDALSTMLMNIGLYSPRVEKYALLYPASKGLQKELCNYYSVVVDLCTKIVLFVKKPAVKQMANALRKPFDDEFGTFRRELTRLGSAVKDEVSIAAKQQQNLEMEESAQERKENYVHRAAGAIFRKETSAALEHMKKMQENRLRTRLLDMCSTYNFETALNQARKKGSTSWIFETNEYQQWVSDDSHSTLLCTGIVGSGKSVLCANVVEELTLKKPATADLAYFFCRYDNAASLKAREIVGSLARQLIQNLPINSRGLSHLPSGVGNIKLDTDQILSSILVLLPPERRYYLLLDGMDECDDSETVKIIQAIQSLLTWTRYKFKIFWTTRTDLSARFFEQLRPDYQVHLSALNNGLTISRFIDLALAECLESGKLRLHDPEIILDIREALEAGAQEMFLWVAFQIESVCAQISDHEILRSLKDLPRGLPATFRRILCQLQDSKVANPGLARKIFGIIAAAQRPLNLAELGEAISVIPGETTWDDSKIVNDVRKALESCGSFLLVDEEYSTVHFAHSSVRHHVLSKPTDKDMSDYHIGLITADLSLGSICITYLNLDVLSTQLTNSSRKSLAYAASVPTAVIESVLPRRHAVNARALALLRSRRTSGKGSNLDQERSANLLRETDKRMREVFYFLSYCQENWLHHSRMLHHSRIDQAHVIKRLWNRLVEGRVTTVELPWAPENISDLGQLFKGWLWQDRHIPLLRKVVEKCWNFLAFTKPFPFPGLGNNIYNDLVPASIEKAYIVSFEELLGLLEVEGERFSVASCGSTRAETLLRLAVDLGCARLTRLVLEVGVDVNSRVKSELHGFQNALYEAINRDNGTAVALLIEHGADVNRDGGKILQFCASRQTESPVLEILLERGAEVNAIGGNFGTALNAAALNSCSRNVETLLKAGADASIESKSDMMEGSAFAAAVLSPFWDGQIEIMGMLAKAGADINCRVVKKWLHEERPQLFSSPLAMVVEFKNHEIIDFLLDAGADVTVPARNGESLLKWAARGTGLPTVPKLLKHDAEIELGPNPPALCTERYFKKLYETDSETAKVIYDEYVRRGHRGTITGP